LLNETIKEIEKDRLIETPLIDDERHGELEKEQVHSPDEKRELFKKRQANFFGFEEDCEQLNSVIILSNQAIGARRKFLMLSADRKHLVYLDIINRVNDKRADIEKTAFHELYDVLTGFLELFGLKFLNGVPTYDGRSLTNKDRLKAYKYLGMCEHELKILHGMALPSTKEEKDKLSFVSRVLSSLGLKLTRHRTEGETWYTLNEWRVRLLTEDCLRALKTSKSVFFKDVEELPQVVESYYYAQLSGSTERSFLYQYIQALPEELKLAFVEKLNERFKTDLQISA